MKQLIISIYDGGYGGYDAKSIDENGKVKTVKITQEQAEEPSKYLKKVAKQYDMVIICDNGSIEVIKNDKFEKDLDLLDLLKRLVQSDEIKLNEDILIDYPEIKDWFYDGDF